jgi:hypothetical protein
MDPRTTPGLAQYVQDHQCSISDVWITFTVDPPTTRNHLSEINLYPGRVDAVALEFFGYGACCLLAGAMHELSGWPLWAFKRAVEGTIHHHVHMGVQTPDGLFLDITGPRTRLSVREVYGDGWFQIVTLAQAAETGSIRAEGWDSGITDPFVRETILYFADQLIRQAQNP